MHCDKVASGAHGDKTVPNCVRVPYSGVEGEKNNPDGVREATCNQPHHAWQRYMLKQWDGCKHNQPTHGKVQAS